MHNSEVHHKPVGFVEQLKLKCERLFLHSALLKTLQAFTANQSANTFYLKIFRIA